MSTQAARVPMTLPARYFTDPELFRAEMERFYFRTWICAGRADQIPHAGDYFLRDAAGESIIITRDAGGVVRAFFNVCRHRGTRMCTAPQGAFAGRISCPYHGWAYGLDGSLLGVPHMRLRAAEARDFLARSAGTLRKRLPRAKLKTRNDSVPDQASLR